MKRYVKDAAKFLLEAGLLGEINRKVLHPLGLALIVKENLDGTCKFSNELLDCRDDFEGISFPESSLKDIQKKLESAPKVDEFRRALYPPCGVQPLVEEKDDRGEREDC